jgi:hypothetical protein
MMDLGKARCLTVESVEYLLVSMRAAKCAALLNQRMSLERRSSRALFARIETR